jgi:peroxiredoxin
VASLVGTRLPDVDLPASNGSSVNLARLTGTTVVFFYPYTGRPDHPNPPGWDDIPGAHGSTPQALAFSKLYSEFLRLDVKVFGLSFQPREWQSDFVTRNALPFQLLSDEARAFSNALRLETFSAGNHDYLARRGLIIENGTIRHDMFPVTSPERHAAEMLILLES